MARCLFLLVMLLPCFVWSQKPGRWYGAPLGRGEWMQLHADSTFEYQFHDCTRDLKGTGTWNRLGDSLHLVFGPFPDSLTPSVEWVVTHSDSLAHSLEATVTDDLGQAFESAFVRVVSSEGKTVWCATTDEYGSVHWTSEKPEQFSSLVVRWDAVQIATFTRPDSLSGSNWKLNIQIPFGKLDGYLPGGTQYSYRVVEESHRRMLLKSKDWKSAGWFILNPSRAKVRRFRNK